MTAEEKWEQKFDLHWRLLAPASRKRFLVGLRKWQVWCVNKADSLIIQTSKSTIRPDKMHAVVRLL